MEVSGQFHAPTALPPGKESKWQQICHLQFLSSSHLRCNVVTNLTISSCSIHLKTVTICGRLWYAVCCSCDVGFAWRDALIEGLLRWCLRTGLRSWGSFSV